MNSKMEIKPRSNDHLMLLSFNTFVQWTMSIVCDTNLQTQYTYQIWFNMIYMQQTKQIRQKIQPERFPERPYVWIFSIEPKIGKLEQNVRKRLTACQIFGIRQRSVSSKVCEIASRALSLQNMSGFLHVLARWISKTDFYDGFCYLWFPISHHGSSLSPSQLNILL